MAQSLDRLKESASQTAGPYVHIGLTPNFSGIHGVYEADLGATLINEKTRGERIEIKAAGSRRLGYTAQGCAGGDLAGRCRWPLQLALRASRHRRSEFHRMGSAGDRHDDRRMRVQDDQAGPRAVQRRPSDGAACHVWIVARGINIGLHTRMYFGDEEEANAEDPVLARIEHRERVPTLIAPRDGDTYNFDIHLQGERETVFFDI